MLPSGSSVYGGDLIPRTPREVGTAQPVGEARKCRNCWLERHSERVQSRTRRMLPSRGVRCLSHCSRPRPAGAGPAAAAPARALPPPPAARLHTATLAPRPHRQLKKLRQVQMRPTHVFREPSHIAGTTNTAAARRNFHSTQASGPAAAYDHQVATGVISNDDHQRSIVQILQRMHDDLERYRPPPIGPLPPPVKPSAWTRLMRSRLFADMADELHQANTAVIPLPPPPSNLPKGLYLYGSVGCGKSFLMDLFYANLPEKYKRPGGPGNTRSFGSKRVHFHQFMMDVHKKGHKIKIQGGAAQDWIVIAAREIAEETRVLCFDEFQVNLGSLLCTTDAASRVGSPRPHWGCSKRADSLDFFRNAGHRHRGCHDPPQINGSAARTRRGLRHDLQVSPRCPFPFPIHSSDPHPPTPVRQYKGHHRLTC